MEATQRKADASVRKTKAFFLVGLSVTAIVAAAVSGYLVAQSETKTFEEKYLIYAHEIAVRSFQNAAETFSSMRGLGKALTSHGIHQVVKFPFITLPNWEERTEEARRSSFDELMAFVPLVDVKERSQWEFYASWNQQWIQQGLESDGILIKPDLISKPVQPFPSDVEPENFISFVSIMEKLSSAEQRQWVLDAYRTGPTLEGKIAPLWQMGPAPTNVSVINVDLLTSPGIAQLLLEVVVNRHGVLAPFSIVGPKLLGDDWRGTSNTATVPRSGLIEPIFETFEKEARVAGFLVSDVPWPSYFIGVLPEGVGEILVVVRDTCGNTEFTLLLDGPTVELMGYGDHHDHQYNNLAFYKAWKSGPGSVVVDKHSDEIVNTYAPDYPHHCEFNIAIYPHTSFSTIYLTKRPLIVSISVLAIFFFCAASFFVYDYAVGHRQRRLLWSAQKTSSVVSSLFPKSIQDRVLADAEARLKQEMEKKFLLSGSKNKKQRLKSHLDFKPVDATELETIDTKPIADLFPETTLMIADIFGFSAWSSTRDPQQVFKLLETIYQALDKIAKEHRVYKVESTGDQYVAVSGLPEPTKNHALVMAKFAQACLREFEFLTRRLESTLGPDTSELGLSVGLHSGSVVAGVLRGERSRFQLFGDSVNLCGSIARTSDPNRIQISETTAQLLKAAGKDYWLSERQEDVVFRGQVPIRTYWLALFHFSGGHSFELTRSLDRMISWNVEVLSDFLKQVIARRMHEIPSETEYLKSKDLEIKMLPHHRWAKVIDEVTEYIDLPSYKAKWSSIDVSSFELESVVKEQLHAFVTVIAELHNDNAFHNFEHASHVLLAIVKLLGRIVAPEGVSDGEVLHDHTFGITSDPLVGFSMAFATLIHDVGHPGVPNNVLVSEGNEMAIRYQDRSVSEQNSVDLAFSLLLQDKYTALREAIYQTPEELIRFRKLVVNNVISTDLWDVQMNQMRNDRWNKAFSSDGTDIQTPTTTTTSKESANRKASIVLEHLITASDISHCMQHWAIYVKWNENLFRENYAAYESGRTLTNPVDYWYDGELKFFDQYVIPLAKKLKSCGIFGVSSVENLDYAMQNRNEWKARGRQVVAEYVNNTLEQSSWDE